MNMVMRNNFFKVIFAIFCATPFVAKGEYADVVVFDDSGIGQTITVDLEVQNEIGIDKNKVLDQHACTTWCDFFRNTCYEMYEALSSLMADIRDRCSYEHGFEQVDGIAQGFFSDIYLRMLGYYNHPPETGCCGNGEVSDRVRITMINGILNLRQDVVDSAKLISELHGGSNVHYIFKPTRGWAGDVAISTYVKCGGISQQAVDMVNVWRRLIEEMGGVDNGGHIIHYAHSIGAADTYVARYLLTPEELQMISVITFGSPLLIPNNCFRYAVNYASVRDGVPLIGHIGGIFVEDKHVIYVGDHFGIPFIDHLLNNDSYRSIIETLGKEFVELYGDTLRNE